MRYLVGDKLIRSENAAKSHKQKSKHVAKYILSRPLSGRVMDFGCGKLRYSDEITSIGVAVTFVDSVLQLSRKQIVRGHAGSVIDYISKNYPSADFLSFENILIGGLQARYDFITCTNVLSAIPCLEYLSRVLEIIFFALQEGAEAIFVNQHSCSSFSKFKTGQRHMYGHIYENRFGFFYYGVMTNMVVVELLASKGFEVVRSWSEEDVGFVLVRRPTSGIDC